MKLSEAMRIGARMHPQATGWLWLDSSDHPTRDHRLVASTCAIGAACMGAGVDTETTAFRAALTRPYIPCPKCGGLSEYLGHAVVHLNDDHHEPRERIADWLEEQGL